MPPSALPLHTALPLRPARWIVAARTGEAANDLLTVPRLAPQGVARSLARGAFRLATVSHTTDEVAIAPADDPRARRDAELVELLQAAATGNASAFERFYDMTIGYAQTLGRRMLPSADVEDVVADAYFQAWREVRSFDAQRGSPVTWLLTLLRSRALDLLRRHKASPEVAGADDESSQTACAETPGPVELLAGIEANSRLARALLALSAQERWVLGLAYYRELSHREVCEQTGLPLGTVKSLILRAQAKLRSVLAECHGPD